MSESEQVRGRGPMWRHCGDRKPHGGGKRSIERVGWAVVAGGESIIQAQESSRVASRGAGPLRRQRAESCASWLAVQRLLAARMRA